MAEHALQESVRGISARLQELRSQRERVRRQVTSIKNVWNLPEHVRLAALWIYENCDWCSEPSVLFLHSYAKRRQWPYMNAESVARLVENMFLDIDMNELLNLTDRFHAAGCPLVVRDAYKYSREWKVVAWIRSQNGHHGVAPTTAQLLAHAHRNGIVDASVINGQTCTGRPNNRARAWASKFRKRWHARIGRVVPVGEMGEVEMRTKVRSMSFRILTLRSHFWQRCACLGLASLFCTAVPAQSVLISCVRFWVCPAF